MEFVVTIIAPLSRSGVQEGWAEDPGRIRFGVASSHLSFSRTDFQTPRVYRAVVILPFPLAAGLFWR